MTDWNVNQDPLGDIRDLQKVLKPTNSTFRPKIWIGPKMYKAMQDAGLLEELNNETIPER